MSNDNHRPFYGEYAWAYDLITFTPVAAQCDFIQDAFNDRGVSACALVLDAGCGTGGHAFELARRDYTVEGIDASAELIAEARARAEQGGARTVSFSSGDILELKTGPRYDGILCRGVLNDILDDECRRRVFQAFARALRPAGALVLDVREWEATAERKRREPVFERTVETSRGLLTFRSETRLDTQTRRLLVAEQHTLYSGDGRASVSVYDFRMRCWTREELHERLTEAGFGALEYFGAYDRNVPAGATDRLVCVASASKKAKVKR